MGSGKGKGEGEGGAPGPARGTRGAGTPSPQPSGSDPLAPRKGPAGYPRIEAGRGSPSARRPGHTAGEGEGGAPRRTPAAGPSPSGSDPLAPRRGERPRVRGAPREERQPPHPPPRSTLAPACAINGCEENGRRPRGDLVGGPCTARSRINPMASPRVTPYVPDSRPGCGAWKRKPRNRQGNGGTTLAASSSSGGTSQYRDRPDRNHSARRAIDQRERRNTHLSVTRRKREHFELRTKVGRIRTRDRRRIRGSVRRAAVVL